MMENGEGGEKERRKGGGRWWLKEKRGGQSLRRGDGKRRKSLSFQDSTVSECRQSHKHFFSFKT